MSRENNVILSIGSNCDESYVSESIRWLAQRLRDFHVSAIYITPAVKDGARHYHNAVASGWVEEDMDALNESLKEYEESHGRDAECRCNGIVPIDIDIVVWNGEVVRQWDFRQTFFRIGYNEILEPASEPAQNLQALQ